MHVGSFEPPAHFSKSRCGAQPLGQQMQILARKLDARRIRLCLRPLWSATPCGRNLLRGDNLSMIPCRFARRQLGELLQLPEQLALAVFSSGRTHSNPFSAKLSGSAAPATMK